MCVFYLSLALPHAPPPPDLFDKMIIDSKPLVSPLTIHLLQGDEEDEQNTAFSNQVLQIKLDVL